MLKEAVVKERTENASLKVHTCKFAMSSVTCVLKCHSEFSLNSASECLCCGLNDKYL